MDGDTEFHYLVSSKRAPVSRSTVDIYGLNAYDTGGAYSWYCA